MLKIILLLVLSTCIHAEAINIYVDNNPPYSFIKHGKVSGAFVEAFSALLDSVNISYKFHTLPPKRSLAAIESDPSGCALGIPYNGANAEVMTYMKRVAPLYLSAMVRSSSKIRASKIEDLKPYRIASIDIPEVDILLKKSGIDYIKLSAENNGINMLNADRFEVLISNTWQTVKQNTENPPNEIYALPRIDLWLACNRNLNKAISGKLHSLPDDGLLYKESSKIWDAYELGDFYKKARGDWVKLH